MNKGAILQSAMLGFMMSASVGATYAHDHSHEHHLHGQNQQSFRPLDFIENKGQWVEEAKYKVAVPGGAVFLTGNGFMHNYVSMEDLNRIHDMTCGKNVPVAHANLENEVINQHAFRVTFVGANERTSFATTDKRSHYHNYIIGNDRSKWAGNVGLYGKITQYSVYDGIDLHVYSNNGKSLKYDFVVSPGANPNLIQMTYDGISPQLTREGHLKITTTVNEIQESAPYTYQVIEGNKVEVLSNYRLHDGVVSFAFPEGYNAAYPLVIDPDIVFATFSGSTGGAVYAHSTTYDSLGNMYASGLAGGGVVWPVTTGAYQVAVGGSNDLAINKYSPDGSTLLYSTYFGGSGDDHPYTLRVDNRNQLVMAGLTTSADLPMGTGPYDMVFNGGTDLFVARFSEDGSTLVGSTYVGGTGNEPALFDVGSLTPSNSTGLGSSNTYTSPVEITIDAWNHAWVVSTSNSTDFPQHGNVFQTALAGGYDGVMFRIDPNCSVVSYSSYFGGAQDDIMYAVEINSEKQLVIGGGTKSNDLPITPGTFMTAYPGGSMSGFVAVFDSTGSDLLYSTYLGTNGDDNVTKIQIDCSDNIFALGRTTSTYLISPGVFATGGDIFLQKLSSDLSSPLLSTSMGNVTGGRSMPSAFLVDNCGQAHIAFLNASTGQPLSLDAFDTVRRGFWFGTLSPDFEELVFGSYFGLNDHTHPSTSRFDPDGLIYHSVCGTQDDFPTTEGSWAKDKTNTANDVISFKFDFEANPLRVKYENVKGANEEGKVHAVRGCKSAYLHYSRPDAEDSIVVQLTIEGDAIRNDDYQLFLNGNLLPVGEDSVTLLENEFEFTIEVKPLLAPAATGPRNVVIATLASCACDGLPQEATRDSVWIYDSLYVSVHLTPADTTCPGDERSIKASIDTTLNFTWANASNIPNSHTLTINPRPYETTEYSITVTQPGAPGTCPPRTAYYTATVEPFPIITIPNKHLVTCPKDSVDLLIYVQPEDFNFKVEWKTEDNIGNPNSMRAKFFTEIPGTYEKTVRVFSPVAECMTEDRLTIQVEPPFKFDWISPVDTTIKYGEQVQLDSESEAIAWYWYPVTYLSSASVKNPIASPKKSIEYTLVGMNQYGCTDTAFLQINVEHETKVAIPSGFSPNGDGQNDVFKIANVNFETLQEFRVYNRYGQIVFETNDIEKGWDGTYKGEPAPMDTYMYVIRVTLTDGTPKVFTGDVTLLR